MDISLITSLYRSEAYIEAFTRRVLGLAEQLRHTNLSVEIVIIANDASVKERETVEHILSEAQKIGSVCVQALYVERETIYASWNRGIRASSGDIIGFWNVDDERTVEGLIEAHRLIQGGCEVVDFPIDTIIHQQRLGQKIESYRRSRVTFSHDVLTHKTILGTFFMFARPMFERIGAFDEHFFIAGDSEWAARARGKCRFCASEVSAGKFHVHGKNLSNTGSARELVESNIILLRHGAGDKVRPTPNPQLMRDCWEQWGNTGHISVPGELQAKLWGIEAKAFWDSWQRQQQIKRISSSLRRIPGIIIDTLGLRAMLVRLGLAKPLTLN